MPKHTRKHSTAVVLAALATLIGGCGSDRPTPAPDAGRVINFGSLGTTADIDCGQGNSLKVGGSNNTLKVVGSCASVTVSGADNAITLERVDDEISVDGLNNAVTYRGGDPEVTDSGSGNRITQG